MVRKLTSTSLRFGDAPVHRWNVMSACEEVEDIQREEFD
jgi:hypothetical protein